LRIAYSLPLERIAFRRNRSGNHQFQLRMALLSGRRVAKPGPLRIRAALPAVQEPADADPAGCGRAVSPAGRGTVIGGRTLARMGRTAFLSGSRRLVTPVSRRGYHPLSRESSRG